MSSSQELYNRLNEKLRELVRVKNRKQVSNWIWVIVGILQSQSCNLSQVANYLPLATKAESRVTMIRRWLMNPQVKVWSFYKQVLEHVLSGWSQVEACLILDGVMIFGDRWQIFRLFLMPFCVSSFAALVKDAGFLLVFPPEPAGELDWHRLNRRVCGACAGVNTKWLGEVRANG